MKNSSRLSRLQKVGLVSAGVVAGAVIAATGFASAVDNTTTPAPSTQSQQSEDTNENAQAPNRPGTPGGRDMNRPAEEALTGDVATKVEAAVMAKYPGATIERTEMDAGGEGVYEAHIIKADGTRAVVFLDAGFAVTGEKECGPDGGSHGGKMGGSGHKGPGREGHGPMSGPGHEGPGHEGPGHEGPRHEGHGGPGDIDDDAPAAPSDVAPSTSTPSA
jgi:hypothetical protein